ncbi:MAG: hypothetical protein U9Q83_00575 [Bacteroidota bacterium]|nr:hypothetical protein [Bacteroidota bacterium]
MKKYFIILSLVFFVFACNNSDNDSDQANNDSIPVVQLANFDAEASEYVDKQIKINGIIDHVCKHGGKKLLVVNQEGTADIHVESDIRFNDSLAGSEVTIIGVVTEFRIDEAYCQKLETDALNEHAEGDDADEVMESKIKQAQFYRDSMQSTGVDHLSFYSLEFIKFVK